MIKNIYTVKKENIIKNSEVIKYHLYPDDKDNSNLFNKQYLNDLYLMKQINSLSLGDLGLLIAHLNEKLYTADTKTFFPRLSLLLDLKSLWEMKFNDLTLDEKREYKGICMGLVNINNQSKRALK
ncbi:MAG: hypothetical protein VZS44_00665 [Bacilli bacterium]|nr:hypothetical protein [Bacilli bacterium]